MRRGCIAVGIIKCDNCGSNIEHGDRYLLINGDNNKKIRYCVNCSIKKKYAKYITEKGEKILSFLIEQPDSKK